MNQYQINSIATVTQPSGETTCLYQTKLWATDEYDAECRFKGKFPAWRPEDGISINDVTYHGESNEQG
jgi:hypothetical protein